MEDNWRLIAYDRSHLILMTSIIKNPFGRSRIKEKIIPVINETIIILKIIISPRLSIFSYLYFQNLHQWSGASFHSSITYFFHASWAKIQPVFHSKILISYILQTLQYSMFVNGTMWHKRPRCISIIHSSGGLFVLFDCSRSFIKPLGVLNQIEQCFQAKLISSGQRLFLNPRLQYI